MICLFNVRQGLVDEIMSDATVGSGIAEEFARYVSSSDLEDAVLGFVQSENDSERRFDAIMSAFRRLASMCV